MRAGVADSPHDERNVLWVRESRVMRVLGLAIPCGAIALAGVGAEYEFLPRPVFLYVAAVMALWAVLMLPALARSFSRDNWVLAVGGNGVWLRGADAYGRDDASAARRNTSTAPRKIEFRHFDAVRRIDERTVSWSNRQVKRESRRCWLEIALQPQASCAPASTDAAAAASCVRVLWRGPDAWRVPSLDHVLRALRRRGVRVEPAQSTLVDLTQ